MKVKASAFIKWIIACIGLGYVYSAIGQVCTIALLTTAQKLYGNTMGEGYFQKGGDYNKGRCARWLGKVCYDCSGLMKSARKALTGVWQDVSAQGLYDQCTTKRGIIASMPLIPGTLVFMFGKTQGRMVHVGCYVGGGYVVESRGVDYGVVKTKLSSRAWTHWGQVSWMELDLKDENGKAVPGREADCGDNSTPKKDDVEALAELVGAMLSDGIVTDKDYWTKVLKGEIVPKPEYLQTAFRKATEKI